MDARFFFPGFANLEKRRVMAFIRALRELELFHFLQRSTECRRCLLILACDSAFLRWSAARVEIQRASGRRRGGEKGGVVVESEDFP